MTTLAMRDRLIETALAQCYQHGFHAVGVDRIAKEAGATRATLYNHFASKDELALAVVAKRDAWWQETFCAEMKRRGGDDPLDQLRSVPEILRDWFATDGFNGCLFINAASEFPSSHDPITGRPRPTSTRFAQWLPTWPSEQAFATPRVSRSNST